MKAIRGLPVLFAATPSLWAVSADEIRGAEPEMVSFPFNSVGFQVLGTSGMVVVTTVLVLLMAAIWRSREAFTPSVDRSADVE